MKYSGLCLMCHIGTERIRMLVYVITTDNSLWNALRKEYIQKSTLEARNYRSCSN